MIISRAMIIPPIIILIFHFFQNLRGMVFDIIRFETCGMDGVRVQGPYYTVVWWNEACKVTQQKHSKTFIYILSVRALVLVLKASDC